MESITEAEERRTGHRKRFSGKKVKLDGVIGVLSVYGPLCSSLSHTELPHDESSPSQVQLHKR